MAPEALSHIRSPINGPRDGFAALGVRLAFPHARSVARPPTRLRPRNRTDQCRARCPRPSRRLWIEISITVSLVHNILPCLFCRGRKLVHMPEAIRRLILAGGEVGRFY